MAWYSHTHLATSNSRQLGLRVLEARIYAELRAELLHPSPFKALLSLATKLTFLLREFCHTHWIARKAWLRLMKEVSVY